MPGVKGWAAIVLVLALAGCGAPKADEEPAGAADGAAVSYAELARHHNKRVKPIERMWARAVIEARWRDEDGAKRFEQGDGPLILRKPNELALAIGKLGHTRLWLGANGRRYWLFDLAGEQHVAYVGKLDGEAGAAGGLPVPVRPDALIELLGVTPLDASLDAAVERTEAGHIAALPADDEAGRPAGRLTFDAAGRLRRYEVLDDEGETLLSARLDAYERMPLTGEPPGAHPPVPTRIAIRLPERDAGMTLHLSQLTDNPAKVRDVHFDFDKLARLHDVQRTVDLDQRRQRATR